MDMKAKIAARRAELEGQTRESERVVAEQVKAQQAAAQVQREEALDEIAAQVSREGLDVRRVNGELRAETIEPPPLDYDGLKQSAINKLLAREARKMWSPSENWQVITAFVAGVFLVPLYGIGLVLIFMGFLARKGHNEHYTGVLKDRYPGVFPSIRPPTSD